MKLVDRVRLIKQQLIICGGVGSLDAFTMNFEDCEGFRDECYKQGLLARRNGDRFEIERLATFEASDKPRWPCRGEN